MLFEPMRKPYMIADIQVNCEWPREDGNTEPERITRVKTSRLASGQEKEKDLLDPSERFPVGRQFMPGTVNVCIVP